MSEWSSNLAERIRKERSEKEVADRAFLERQRLKQAFGGSLWQDVIKETQACCEDLNRDAGRSMVSFETGSQSLRIESGRNRLLAEFRSEQAVLQWRTDLDSRRHQYVVSTTPAGTAAFCRLQERGETSCPVTARGIAEEMLEALFLT